MIRKSLLTLVGLCVVMGVAIVVAGQFSKPAPVAHHRTQAPQRRTTLAPWNGKLEQTYDTSFLRGGEDITLQSVDYRAMNARSATAVVNLQVVKGQGSLKWLKASSFRVLTNPQSTGGATAHDVQYRPKMKAVWSGSTKLVTLTFRRLPTASLASGCASSASGCAGLDVFGPDGEFAVGLDAPSAPGGYALGQSGPVGSTDTTATTAPTPTPSSS